MFEIKCSIMLVVLSIDFITPICVQLGWVQDFLVGGGRNPKIGVFHMVNGTAKNSLCHICQVGLFRRNGCRKVGVGGCKQLGLGHSLFPVAHKGL